MSDIILFVAVTSWFTLGISAWVWIMRQNRTVVILDLIVLPIFLVFGPVAWFIIGFVVGKDKVIWRF